MNDKELNFFEECSRGNEDKVAQCIQEGISVDTVKCTNDGKDETEMSALCVSAFEGQLEVVKLLISKSANVNYRCKHGESALFLAARKGYPKIVQCLLEAGAYSVYTVKPGEKVLYENWEVFTQVLSKVYPNNINNDQYKSHKAVAQILVDYNAESSRPTVLYEALFCALTVFANPIAIYCVGVYSALCSQQAAAVFVEEHFLSALCHAFDSSRLVDFVNTIHALMTSNKLRQKDVAVCLIKHFNWVDLLKRIAEQQSRSPGEKAILKTAVCSMKIVLGLAGNFNVRSALQDQIRLLAADDVSRVGRTVKQVLDSDAGLETRGSSSTTISEETSIAWQFLFFLLKLYLKGGQESCVSRLLLRNNSSQSGEYEKRVLLRSLEEDLSLAHLLLDYGVAFSGECLVQSVQNGLQDLINRFKGEQELLFCKEVEDLLRIRTTVKNSSNRNMRRCLKIIKSQRAAFEEERRRFEAELFEDDAPSQKVQKRRKQRSKHKKTPAASTPSGVDEVESNDEVIDCNGHVQTAQAPVENGCESSKGDTADDHADSSGDNVAESKYNNGKVRKKKNKKRAAAKRKASQDSAHEEEDESLQEPEMTTPPANAVTYHNGWKEIAVVTARRRRQSSSSSDCSTESRKSVHFSHPLVFYENANKKGHQVKQNGHAERKASNLKQSRADDADILLTEAYRTTPPCAHSELIGNSVRYANGIFEFDDGDIPWKAVSPRWAPRFEDLSEMDPDTLKQITWSDEKQCDVIAYLCDDQKHLNIGTGPDFSHVYLGLTGQGWEVAIKRISSKRAPLLAQKEVTKKLLDLPFHPHVSKYHAIVRDRAQCYLVQSVGEYSLEQIFRRKLPLATLLPAQACHQMASALHCLHENDVLHMALKPTNVFTSFDGSMRLADYGIHMRHASSHQRHTQSSSSASSCWMARETLCADAELVYSKQSDVASLGMVMFYSLTGGSHPFGDPDTAPGVCINNINRGSYNLKALTDPLAHHLIRNCIFKECEKRLTTREIIDHPFFWDSTTKETYLSLLAEVALSGGRTSDGSPVLEELSGIEQELLNSYANPNGLIEVSDVYTSSVKGLLTLLYDCMHNDDLFVQCTNEEWRQKAESPALYFSLCFPGLLLHAFKLFSMKFLSEAKTRCDLSSPPLSLDDNDSLVFLDQETNDEPSSPVLAWSTAGRTELESELTDAAQDQIPGKLDASSANDHDPREIPAADLKAGSFEINNTNPTSPQEYPVSPGDATWNGDVVATLDVTDENDDVIASHCLQRNGHSTAEAPALLKSCSESEMLKLNGYVSRKNPALCLSQRQELPSKEPEAATEFVTSPDGEACILFNGDHERDWVQVSNPASNVNGNNEADWHPQALDSSNGYCPANHPSVSSPDDWIEIGSPLGNETTARPTIVTRGRTASVGDGNSSSGGSVDECFDFGLTANPKSRKRLPDKADKHAKLFEREVLAWTDIDELD